MGGAQASTKDWTNVVQNHAGMNPLSFHDVFILQQVRLVIVHTWALEMPVVAAAAGLYQELASFHAFPPSRFWLFASVFVYCKRSKLDGGKSWEQG